MQAKMKVGV